MSDLIVLKFGGTSVGSTERIGEVARRVAKHRRAGNPRIVVVVSAMSGETDKLVELARKVRKQQKIDREYHQLLATGEQVTTALTAMAIEREGLESISLLAPQVRILTTNVYGNELIDQIETTKLEALLDAGVIPVVAGFQGTDTAGNYTTLGRGGSDATAVALAAALKAKQCIIYTDIDGVYTAQPSLCKCARKLERLTYQEMLELAGSGAKVLQARSVRLAMKYRVPLLVASSFNHNQGTEIVEEYPGMEDAVVSGITCRNDQAKITLRNIADRPGSMSKLFSHIAQNGINVDMIVQNQGFGAKATVSFTVDDDQAVIAYEALLAVIKTEFPEASIELDRSIAKVSVVGEGMKAHAGVAAQIFEILGREGINIDLVTTSEIMTAVAIQQKYAELAVRSLHEYFIERKEA
ncbi:aspartate kinase [bacterium]|nr:aspartate kinase [bacterium]